MNNINLSVYVYTYMYIIILSLFDESFECLMFRSFLVWINTYIAATHI
jgi:hypothetical protein